MAHALSNPKASILASDQPDKLEYHDFQLSSGRIFPRELACAYEFSFGLDEKRKGEFRQQIKKKDLDKHKIKTKEIIIINTNN